MSKNTDWLHIIISIAMRRLIKYFDSCGICWASCGIRFISEAEERSGPILTYMKRDHLSRYIRVHTPIVELSASYRVSLTIMSAFHRVSLGVSGPHNTI